MSTKIPTPQLFSLLTVEQCAELLQCSVSQIERFIRSGELIRVRLTSREAGPGQRGPRAWRVTPSALAAFIQSREGREPQKEVDPKGNPAGSGKHPSLPVATGTDGKTRIRRHRR